MAALVLGVPSLLRPSRLAVFPLSPPTVGDIGDRTRATVPDCPRDCPPSAVSDSGRCPRLSPRLSPRRESDCPRGCPRLMPGPFARVGVRVSSAGRQPEV